MAKGIRVGIIGAGAPGTRHADGYRTAGGFQVAAVADLIPSRRKALRQQFDGAKEYVEAAELLADKELDAVSICLPNHLHAPMAVAALRAGKHVVCETPPTLTAAEAKKASAAAAKAGKTLLYAFQRRFGSSEQAAKQAITKGYAGDVYHARAAWMRTRGIPVGTGWFTDKSKSGGGAMIDLGAQMLDLAWHLLGQPKPEVVFGSVVQRFRETASEASTYDVEDAAFALIRFEGGKSLELSASWAINQPPQQQGTLCRIYGDKAAIEVYRGAGPTLYRNFSSKGECKETVLKLPRLVQHAALMRHFRECILARSTPMIGPAESVTLMQMIDAIYKSAASNKSVELR